MSDLFELKDFVDHRTDPVGVSLDDFSEALQTWRAMQNRERVTVAEAMLAFNTTWEVVEGAICSSAWMYLEGRGDAPGNQFIELEGEA